jgi:hypothetical protein
MCPKREIHSKDPSLLILTGNNELGFQGIAPQGLGALLIQPSRKHHSLRMKLTLINNFLLILKGGGGRIHEVEPDWLCSSGARPNPWAAARLSGPSRLRFVSRVFSYLSDYRKVMRALLSLCKPDMWAFLGSFQLTPCRNRHLPKLMELCQ